MTSSIRLRAGIAVVQDARILLVPHFDTDAGPIQWLIPGGGVDFGEYIEPAAMREFKEETGFDAVSDELMDIYENVNLSRQWHSITFFFRGRIVGGEAHQEQTRWGLRTPTWFGLDELTELAYYPQPIIQKALQSGSPARG